MLSIDFDHFYHWHEINSFKIDMISEGVNIWNANIETVGPGDTKSDHFYIIPLDTSTYRHLKETIIFDYELIIEPQDGEDICITESGEILDDSGWILDSPGIRKYGLWHLKPREILTGFRELDR